MRLRAPNFVTWIVTTTLLVACQNGGGRSFPPTSNPTTPTTTVSELSNLRMKIVDTRKFRQLVANQEDKPKYYAIHGNLVDSKRVYKDFDKGAVICYTRLADYPLRSGAAVTVTDVKSGKTGQEGRVHFMSLSRVNRTTNSGISIVCMKINEPVRFAEVSQALRGIVNFIR